MPSTEFSHRVRVYIEDTDAGGIVYYVNYLKFLERARTEFMRSLGYGKSAVLDGGLMFVVKDMSVQYLLPARLDDELDATVSIARLRAAGLAFRQCIRREGESLMEAMVTIACVDQGTMKARRLPPDMVLRLQSF